MIGNGRLTETAPRIAAQAVICQGSGGRAQLRHADRHVCALFERRKIDNAVSAGDPNAECLPEMFQRGLRRLLITSDAPLSEPSLRQRAVPRHMSETAGRSSVDVRTFKAAHAECGSCRSCS